MAARNSVNAVALSSINSTAFNGAYQAINAAGLPNACFMIRIVNNSTVIITISYDGTTDNDFIPIGGYLQLNFQTNGQPNNFIANMKAKTIVYVKGVAGTGLVYLAGYYSPQQ